jgi:hypothetical protein
MAYPSGSLPVGLGFSVPSSSGTAPDAYPPHYHTSAQPSTFPDNSSAWPSSLRYSPSRQHSQIMRSSGHRRSSSSYDHSGQTLHDPVPQHEYAPGLVSTYATGLHYPGIYDVYSSASLPATSSAARYTTSGGIAPTETYLPSSHLLGFHPAPSDGHGAPQEELGNHAVYAPDPTPSSVYESPIPEARTMPGPPLSVPYARGVPRTVNIPAMSEHMLGAWQEPDDTIDRSRPHHGNRPGTRTTVPK